MTISGRKPKAEGMKRNRMPPVHEYRTFPDTPNPKPVGLPSVTELKAATRLPRWPTATTRWWRAVSRLPHTAAWTEADWAYAHETALVHAKFCTGEMIKLAPELRRRNHELGATWEGRRDLRIRYVNAEGVELREDKDPAVTAMADYRKAVE